MGKSASLANIGSVADAPFTFRNRLINGNGVIGQRGTVTLSGAAVSYGADRWLAGISGGSSVTASTLKSSLGGTSSGTGVFITGTFTTGNPYFAQRIEAANVVDMNSKTVTLSGLVYQDTGSSQNFVPRLTKASALDNWSASTTVATGTAFAVPSGVVTPFEVQFTLGSTDATNGLMVEVYAASAITVTSKNFAISDMQLEIGTRKTPFEVKPIGVELMMCQRYYAFGSHYTLLPVGAVNVLRRDEVRFPVAMRVAPTVTFNDNVTLGNVYRNGSYTAVIFNTAIGAFWLQTANGGSATQDDLFFNWFASAEL